jgi:hypothetical protein
VKLNYEDYLKSFYPHQQENVFTNNNWTLSDELLQIIQSNFFYKQHVRWNIQRFRSCDMVINEVDAENEVEAPLTQFPHSKNLETRTSNDNQQEISQQQPVANNSAENEEETAHTWSTSVRSKRKNELNDDLHEHQTRSQSRRMKKS